MNKVKTMRGVMLDVAPIAAQNQDAIAIGNANMNARGDILGPGGKVVKRREQTTNDYHNSNPRSVKSVSLKALTPDVFLTPAEAVAKAKEEVKSAAPAKSGKKIVDDFDD